MSTLGEAQYVERDCRWNPRSGRVDRPRDLGASKTVAWPSKIPDWTLNSWHSKSGGVVFLTSPGHGQRSHLAPWNSLRTHRVTATMAQSLQTCQVIQHSHMGHKRTHFAPLRTHFSFLSVLLSRRNLVNLQTFLAIFWS